MRRRSPRSGRKRFTRTAVDESRQDLADGRSQAAYRGLQASFCNAKGGRLDEIRALIEEALAASETSLDADIWMLYGQLAGVIEQQARQDSDPARRGLAGSGGSAIPACAAICAAPDGDARERRRRASYGRAGNPGTAGALLSHRGAACSAVILVQQGLDGLDQLQPMKASKRLQGILRAGLGEAFGVAGFTDASFSNHEASLVVAETLRKSARPTERSPRSLASWRRRVAGLSRAAARASGGARRCRQARRAATSRNDRRATRVVARTKQSRDAEAGEAATVDAPFRISVREDADNPIAFGTDLLIDVHQSVTVAANAGAELPPLAGDARR